jgi:hypothetical protein
LIVTEMNDNPDPNAMAPQLLEISLRDGTTLRWACDAMLANPSRPLSRERRLRKFLRCLEFSREGLREGVGVALVGLIDRLDEVADVREVCALLEASA